MDVVDVAVIGGGPAGSACAAFCAAAGLRSIVVEREKFPREKVCGDCLNPACWPILNRLGVAERIRGLPHGALERVEFIGTTGNKVTINLPRGENAEIAIKRSMFDDVLLRRAEALGATVCQGTIATSIERTRWGDWKIDTVHQVITAHHLVAADGRNSTVARLRNLLPRPERERVALQTHLSLPRDFGNRVVLQFRPEGYCGQAPVNDHELNVCLVARPAKMNRLKEWAANEFEVSPEHFWRTVTPLSRSPVPPAHENLLLVGDAARVVEPFTGEGIYYALRSGELAAAALVRMIGGDDKDIVLREFRARYARIYRGRLWINRLARSAVLSPRFASFCVRVAQTQPAVLRLLTRRIVP